MIPYEWDEKSNEIRYTSQKSTLCLWYLTLFYGVVEGFYLIGKLATTDYSILSYEASVTFVFHAITRNLATTISLTITVNQHTSYKLLNETLRVHRRYKERFFGDSNIKVRDGLLRFIIFVTVVSIVHPVLGPLGQYLGDPKSYRYIGYAYLPSYIYNSTVGLSLFGIIELFQVFMNTAGTGYMIAVLTTYCSVSTFWMKHLSNMEESWSQRLFMYRSLHVHDGFHNECCSGIWWPMMQNLLLISHVSVNVFLIKCNAVLPLGIVICTALCVVGFTWFKKKCIKGGAELFDLSLKFRWKVTNSGKQMRQIGKSLRCLRTQISFYYPLKMSTFNTFMWTEIEYTINVLLTFFQ